MSDILQQLGGDQPLIPEAEERLAEMEAWNEQIARERARQEGIELNEDHFEVLHFLRRHYVLHGPPVSQLHKLSETLDEAFSERGGGRFLYQLFPSGPINQGYRIAGLPPLQNSTDASFGSVQ